MTPRGKAEVLRGKHGSWVPENEYGDRGKKRPFPQVTRKKVRAKTERLQVQEKAAKKRRCKDQKIGSVAAREGDSSIYKIKTRSPKKAKGESLT